MNEPIGSFAGKTIYDFTCKDIDGNDLSLEKFRGMVCLVVNVATKWGKTAVNYQQLQEIYHELAPRGFAVLAFPCNQVSWFGGLKIFFCY